ncbi:hypothetical protein F2Q68_00025664 [Brassica cretica]|uniref:40S ribosomal protein S27 n=1 Tax=Brassica cretica TaxID=69181 RepID=A0A8S9IA01_BRACR|nr:hypothetical protein F2Q68_00025664 [Brassica cretica]
MDLLFGENGKTKHLWPPWVLEFFMGLLQFVPVELECGFSQWRFGDVALLERECELATDWDFPWGFMVSYSTGTTACNWSTSHAISRESKLFVLPMDPLSGDFMSEYGVVLRPKSGHKHKIKTNARQYKVLQNDIDLLNPPAELEKRKHKLKRLVQSPNSFFMDVKCQGCFNITTVFSHSQTVVVCGNCQTVLCQPTGGKARLTEGCSFRKK